MLKGKTIILGVTGSIAAYKSAILASTLIKAGATVHVIMTRNATQFIAPLTFETLTGNQCLIDTFDRNHDFDVEHVSLAARADACIIAPATANVIAKLAHGIADDMLTTTLLACSCPRLVAPAMNTRMYNADVLQDNLKLLEKYGYTLIAPTAGRLACGDIGTGKMAEPDVIFDVLDNIIGHEKDLSGYHVLVTAGASVEAIDPVRYITNHSTGRMGIALARAAVRRGATVTLVHGAVNVPLPSGCTCISALSASAMFAAVTERAAAQDIIIMAAAVADYTPVTAAKDKIKKCTEPVQLSPHGEPPLVSPLEGNYAKSDKPLPSPSCTDGNGTVRELREGYGEPLPTSSCTDGNGTVRELREGYGEPLPTSSCTDGNGTVRELREGYDAESLPTSSYTDGNGTVRELREGYGEPLPSSSCTDDKESTEPTDIAWQLPLKRTRDILAYLGEHKKQGQVLCGFAMETRDLIENARQKLIRKNCDMIVANSLKTEGAGFGTKTNVATLISAPAELSPHGEPPLVSPLEGICAKSDKPLPSSCYTDGNGTVRELGEGYDAEPCATSSYTDGEKTVRDLREEALPMMTKEELADVIWDRCIALLLPKNKG